VRFRRYAKGSIVAVIDDDGGVLLKHPAGIGLLRTRDGVPQVVVERADAADVAAIFACISLELDRDWCATCGVEVTE
jgi:hypothetical protein